MILNIEAIGFLTIWLAGPNVAKKAQTSESTRISNVASQGNQI